MGGDTLRACLSDPRGPDGTAFFFEKAIGVTDVQAEAAAHAAGCADISENDANAFAKTVGGLPPGTDAAIDFSASSWMAQFNGVAPNHGPSAADSGIDLGSIDALGKPYVLVPPGLEVPNPTFYASGNYAGDTYVVVSTQRIGPSGDLALKSLFTGPGAATCDSNAQDTATKFGIANSVAACGSMTLTGALYS